MFKTLIGKFTFFFWLLFIVVTASGYFFISYHFVDILKKSEEEKITFALDAVKPIIAFDISFNQQQQLKKVLNSLLEHNDIHKIELISVKGPTLFSKSSNKIYHGSNFLHEDIIQDPFDNRDIAIIKLSHSNEHLFHFQQEVYTILFLSFMFALLLFSVAFLYIRDDLKALRIIANSLQEYSLVKNMKPIIQSSKTEEIKTIAKVANEMLSNLAKYVSELKSFNIELEERVEKGILKQQKQETLMIHQSRQAAMGEMLESIAHQWRQPLNIIGLATTKLETDYTLGILQDEDFHDSIQIVATNINYMSDTIDDFRNFLNPQRELNLFSPEKSIQEVFSIIDAQLQNYNIIYNLESHCHPLFYGVANEFKQVMLVLLNNSKDAIRELLSDKKINKGIITISIRCEDDFGVIDITDNGGGINEDILHNIFNPYFSTKGDVNGSGVGLYIAKNIIATRMEGSIGAKNTKDGCCFTISLPIKGGEI